jgi:hypothetical protein
VLSPVAMLITSQDNKSLLAFLSIFFSVISSGLATG